MPELPEVETIKNTVAAAVDGAVILNVIVNQPKLRLPVPNDFTKQIVGARIESFKRIAKYMLINLNNGQTIIWHFGMSGKIKIKSQMPTTFEKHDHLIIETDKGTLIYNDPRRFGLVVLCESDKIKQHKLFADLGPDPWDKEFNTEYLLQKFKNKKAAIKVALLNQTIVCGIGNIYASEILYYARILPNRTSESITKAEAELIVKFTRQVLEEAIEAGGSTIHDYKKPDGDIGYFQQKHCVYNKTGQKCPQCRCNIRKTGGIQKTVLGGRSTFYCNTLQK
ncbi:MAG: bifunctional DNA-formamidopyrimidine glycosylase/DNA-(apurinic or apyrimidinic site) lyase [Alphaproteobacteria bacterium]|nr:bifunctional DNA-formamidopyrimidine glycosylase/DNA-(apurinic or apyrimidinic site) lyase [Alphaproteobacteria bacterium]